MENWIVPVIQGGVYNMTYFTNNKNKKKFKLTYLVRKSVYRPGFKPSVSGINNLGYSANFVSHDVWIESIHLEKETGHVEMNYYFTSGSIPYQVHEDDKMDETFTQRKSKFKNSMAFQSHINSLLKNDSSKVKLLFVGIAGKENDQEKKLGDLFKEDIHKSKCENVRFKKYDSDYILSINRTSGLQDSPLWLDIWMQLINGGTDTYIERSTTKLYAGDNHDLGDFCTITNYNNNQIDGLCNKRFKINNQTSYMHISSLCKNSQAH